MDGGVATTVDCPYSSLEGGVLESLLAMFRGRRAPLQAPARPSPTDRRSLNSHGADPAVFDRHPEPITLPRRGRRAVDRRGAAGYLAVHGVEKSFAGRKVVRGASLYVRQGEAVGLLGPNGAGKTTVFYMITGLIKADRGRIELDGNDITGLPMYQRARLGIGYLPQEASIFRGLNVADNIRAVLEVIEPDRRKRERELDALLEEFDIARVRNSPSIALSGGERRRVEIARALATRPSYMLLDEPFAGIDPKAVGDIQALVRHLNERGIGVLITDHNVRETLGLTDRAYIIYAGEVLMEGSARRSWRTPTCGGSIWATNSASSVAAATGRAALTPAIAPSVTIGPFYAILAAGKVVGGDEVGTPLTTSRGFLG
jgi:lipopolysaccharide export system ATP-binding protein